VKRRTLRNVSIGVTLSLLGIAVTGCHWSHDLADPWVRRASDAHKDLTARRDAPASQPVEDQVQGTTPTGSRGPRAELRRLPLVAAADQADRDRHVRLVSHAQPAEADQAETIGARRAAEEPHRLVAFDGEGDAASDAVETVPPSPTGRTEYPIDLANALALGGASNLQIRLARERVIQSQARLIQARVLWLPSLRAGIGYTRHDGQIQATEGDVIQAGRNSLFVGGGAGLGNAPLTGGAGGPARLMVNLALADAIFKPLSAVRIVRAESSAATATVNDANLAIAEAYYAMVEAYALAANAEVARQAADAMAHTVELFAREGGGSEAEVDRAGAERQIWRQAVEERRRQAVARGAELVRLVRLDPSLTVVPAEDRIAPVTLIDRSVPKEALLAQGLTSRPELSQYRWLVDAALRRLREERWRPWLPSVQVGASGGPFGGGQSSIFDNQSGRGDLDLLAVWEWRNLGIGNHSIQQERASQVRQACLEVQQVRDRIMAEIVTAANDVHSYAEQMESAAAGVAAAEQSYSRNRQRIGAGEGIPIELLQSIRARASAQDATTRATASYNRAEYRLLRAIGRPIEQAETVKPSP